MSDTVPISGETIRLGQFLKFASVVEQGSDAKLLLEEARVRVNGEVEHRRGRQLSHGDVVEIDDLRLEVTGED